MRHDGRILTDRTDTPGGTDLMSASVCLLTVLRADTEACRCCSTEPPGGNSENYDVPLSDRHTTTIHFLQSRSVSDMSERRIFLSDYPNLTQFHPNSTEGPALTRILGTQVTQNSR